MGNGSCARSIGVDNFCIGRGYAAFSAPNTENVTYAFDFTRDEFIELNGQSQSISAKGFQLESAFKGERSAPRWCKVKEYQPIRCASVEHTPSPAQLRVIISGRALIRCPDPPAITAPASQPVCVFRLCTRGRPIYESVRTPSFWHTAQVVTSGVFFSLSLVIAGVGATNGGMPVPAGSLFLVPRIVLVLESGDEVVLVEDKLGPLQAPQSFYTDFAIVDDGGRNLQLDFIFRAAEDSPHDQHGANGKGGGMRTLRTCLQDYSVLNSQAQPACISLGYSGLGAILPTASVHLQHLVVSEVPTFQYSRGIPPPEPKPFDAWKAVAHRQGKESSNRMLFEGQDARAADLAIEGVEAVVKHPQLQPIVAMNGQRIADEASCGATDFWYHINYNEDTDGKADLGASEYTAQIRGEFWLTKNAVDKSGVYFHCSSTLAQALTMCIIFRFTCPFEYVSLIESRSASILRDAHIPTNGLVMGIERDPRHGALMRMFLEHRNEIQDDMVICECRTTELLQCVVHQEVYDSGETIYYRLTLLHGNGSRQSAVLQIDEKQIEERSPDTARTPGHTYRQPGEDPSSRFPISPNSPQHVMSPINRIFVYTGVAHETSEEFVDADSCGENGSAGGEESAEYGTPTMDYRYPEQALSEGNPDDWQSAGGDFEHDSDPASLAAARRSASLARIEEASKWRRPVIGSVSLLSKLKEQPFQCLPKSL